MAVGDDESVAVDNEPCRIFLVATVGYLDSYHQRNDLLERSQYEIMTVTPIRHHRGGGGKTLDHFSAHAMQENTVFLYLLSWSISLPYIPDMRDTLELGCLPSCVSTFVQYE